MKKIFALMSAFTLLLTSCNESDSNSGPTQSQLLTKMVETFDDGSTLTTTYTYDGNNLMKWENSDGEKEEFTYNSSNQVIASVKQEFGSGSSLETINVTFTYDAQARLISISESDGILLEYIHNTDGTITEKNYGVVNTVQTLSTEFKCTYDALGNLTSQVGTSVSSGDNFINQFASRNAVCKNQNFPKEMFISYFGFDNVNNLISSVYNSDAADDLSYSIQYTYDVYGYPVGSTETYGSGEVILTEYFYNN